MCTFWSTFAQSLLLFLRLFPNSFSATTKPLIIKEENEGDDILLTSQEIKTKSFQYHFGAFAATVGAWTGKFLLILAIITLYLINFL